MRHLYLFYNGTEYLTEAIAESEDAAREQLTSFTNIHIGSQVREMSMAEFRIAIGRATVKMVSLPAGFCEGLPK